MKNLTRFALTRPVSMVLSLITILYFGLQGVFSSPLELTPDTNYPMMIVYTVYPGAGHDVWTRTYANPELYEWFLKRKLEKK